MYYVMKIEDACIEDDDALPFILALRPAAQPLSR